MRTGSVTLGTMAPGGTGWIRKEMLDLEGVRTIAFTSTPVISKAERAIKVRRTFGGGHEIKRGFLALWTPLQVID